MAVAEVFGAHTVITATMIMTPGVEIDSLYSLFGEEITCVFNSLNHSFSIPNIFNISFSIPLMRLFWNVAPTY